METLRTAGGRVVDVGRVPRSPRLYGGGYAIDWRRLRQIAGGDAFITTEKDAVKLTPELRARLEGSAVAGGAAARLSFWIRGDVVRELEARLR